MFNAKLRIVKNTGYDNIWFNIFTIKIFTVSFFLNVQITHLRYVIRNLNQKKNMLITFRYMYVKLVITVTSLQYNL